MYEAEIRHDGLHKYRVIRGNDRYVVEQKANSQLKTWEEMWQKKETRENSIRTKETKIAFARSLTEEASEALNVLENVLRATLDIHDAVDWESLKDSSEFSEPKPISSDPIDIPREPQRTDAEFQPRLNFLDKLISSRHQQKQSKAAELFEENHLRWCTARDATIAKTERAEERYQSDLAAWNARRDSFLESQRESDEAIDRDMASYINGEKDAIGDYCDLVLTNSTYPEYFPQDYELDYTVDNRSLIVEYVLPTVDDLPTLREVKYIQSRDELQELKSSEAVLNRMYDSVVYQISLRTIHELFEADIIGALDAVTFNGWVKYTDKGTGQLTTACILSIQAQKEAFLAIDLAKVDPRTCFRTLKGVGSSRLHSMAPVAPIVRMNREDSRFVSAYGVVEGLDDSINLASMDWEDFEHLVREVFEKEFSVGGGEVKVTRASRDGGVDAVAFDPDPIRGGKIVIQAKRYTNTVGVSAVRDLYGTVLNEGATKGILVTTATYGPDAYEFAKDKPLTLLSGSNLLHLLEKHGHKARIDLREAKQTLLDENSSR